ncbi:MAG TPA: putative quinol monooxygenase [Thermoanaerobaculia bacterium]|nr:putative quinol monooxygenase [Thermoanaerobaculia bacterium]
MHDGKVHVIAIFVAAAGKEQELEGLLETLVEPTRREAGCLRYDLLRGTPGESGDFVFVEEWESVDTLDAHSQSPHLKSVQGKVGPLLGAPANVARYRQIR